MRSLPRLAAIVAAAALSCAPIAAQTLVKDSALPLAGTLTGSEGMKSTQGSGCATSVSPCANVRVTPAQIATYLGSTFQASDADLTAIAALSTQGFGRSLLTMPDATSARSLLGLGTLATQSGTFSGTSSGTNTGDQTSVSGNAGTATKLATARKVNGVAFDGSADITVNAVDGTARLAVANNLSDVTSPSAALANLGGAPLASPALTGIPTAPTAAAGTATTQVATTGFADTLKDMPQNSLSASYTLVISDRGKHLYYGSNSGNTITIPPNSSVAFPIGARILIINIGGGNQAIAQGSGVRLFGAAGQQNYTLGSGGAGTLIKVGADVWFIFGTGLS